MIGIVDTITLAVAKLKTRRIMMFITVLVAGLMFSVLFAAALIISGALDSFARFDQASDQSFLVKTYPADLFEQKILGSIDEKDKQARIEANQYYLQYLEEQKVLAKQHKIDFDEKSIKPPIKKYQFGDHAEYVYDNESPVVERILAEKQKQFIAKADNNLQGLKKRAAAFHPVNFYETSDYKRNSISGLKFIKDSKEDLLNRDIKEIERSSGWGEASVRLSQYRLEEDVAMKNLILPMNDLRRQNNQAIPVVITAKEAQALFGDKLGIQPAPSDQKQLIKWIEETQTKVNGQTYQVCYRNSAEERLLEEVIEQQVVKDKKSTESSQDQPKIIYNLPATACGRVTIKQDNRTKEDKKRDEAQIAIAKQKGNYQEPWSEIITFQVVGIFPPIKHETRGNNDVADIARDLLTNQIDQGAIIPLSLYRQLPNKLKLDQMFFPPATSDNLASSGKLLDDAGFRPIVVEFASYQNAIDFMDFVNGEAALKYAQQPRGILGWVLGDVKDYYRNRPTDKSKYKFYASPFGRNFATLQSIKHQSRNFVIMVIAIISLIAAIILSLTMARVMSDSRHETAIFRAVGARRGDIAKIYLSYSLIIAMLVIIVSLLFGAIISLVLHKIYSENLTILTKLSYGLFNQNLDFKLFGLNPIWLGVLSLAIVVMSLVAVIPPMLRNVVRNPIKDIKDQ